MHGNSATYTTTHVWTIYDIFATAHSTPLYVVVYARHRTPQVMIINMWQKLIETSTALEA